MLAIFAGSMVLLVAVAMANHSFERDPGVAVLLLAFAAFMVVGALIVARRPGHPIGWLFSAIGLLAATAPLAGEYALYAYVTRPGQWPLAAAAAWYWAVAAQLLFGLALIFTPLLFPTGRLLSRRWRPIAWLAAASAAAALVQSAFSPTLELTDVRYAVPNPIGIAAMPHPTRSTVGSVLNELFLVLMAAAVLSLVVRFRRARGEERQQLKWFAYGGALTVLSVFLANALFSTQLVNLIIGPFVALLPISAGIAILKYRLYDIDRLINRTVVYGLLTVLLGLIYAGAVLLLGQLFGGVGRDAPSWAVAGATLAVAALFQPARRRIQAAVDRRFNRRKYNAARTIEAFSARLRDELDLDTLSAELLSVVDKTMQPTAASLWLRPSVSSAPARDRAS
jgi:hypothetical protein